MIHHRSKMNVRYRLRPNKPSDCVKSRLVRWHPTPPCRRSDPIAAREHPDQPPNNTPKTGRALLQTRSQPWHPQNRDHPLEIVG